MANTLVNCGNPIMAALAVGFSCGTVCSPLVNLFLTTYAMGRFNNMRQGMRAFGYFWGGKTAIVVGSAFLSAILGKAIIGRNGKIFSFNSSLILDICMILTGVLLLAGMFFGRRKAATCSACNVSCQHFDGGIRPKGIMPLVVMGAAYGLTPCAPFLMILLWAAKLTPVQAVLLGLVFSIASSVLPLLILATMAGFFSPKMQREIPQMMRVFQINIFCLFIIVGSISLFRHL
jgi:hypothetical protein